MTKHNTQQWSDYYKAKASDPTPNFLLNRALKSVSHHSIGRSAIDVGCGQGSDTITLLAQGYQVYAIDAQSQAIRHLKRSVRPTWRGRLHAAVRRFEEIRKDDLLQVSLINASYSLFFCRPSSFDRFWSVICDCLEAEGIFVGHFIGPKDDWARRRGMTSVSKLQLTKTLLKDFRILWLKEEENDLGTITGKAKHWHLFSVIAKKRD